MTGRLLVGVPEDEKCKVLGQGETRGVGSIEKRNWWSSTYWAPFDTTRMGRLQSQKQR